MKAARPVWFVCLTVVLALAGRSRADNPRPPLPPSRLTPPRPPLLTAPRTTFPRTMPSRPPRQPADQVQYKFTAGQTFAYRIDIRAEYPDRTERYEGTPVFTVHSVRPDGTAELGSVGRLAQSSRSAGDVWLGSYLRVSRQGLSGGKDDWNVKRLPGALHVFTKPSRLVFAGLPNRIGGYHSHEGSAQLFEMKPGSLPTLGSPSYSVLGPTFSATKGREKDVTRSEDAGTVVRLTDEKHFRTTEGDPREWHFQVTSQFDKARGLVTSTDGTLSYDEKGKKAVTLKMTVRLLAGDELAQAKARAETDRARMPAELDPYELRRVRLDLKDAKRFKTAGELTPGMAVAHLPRGSDYQWYLADVTDVLTEYKVKIRYRGSREEHEAHAGELARVPADKLSRQ